MRLLCSLQLRLFSRNGRPRQAWALPIAFLFLASATSGFGGEQASVYFAGFAQAGNAAQADTAFPITAQLLKERNPDGTSRLEDELWRQVQTSSHPRLNVKRNLASGLSPGDSTTMAVVLEWENVSSETVAGRTKLVADLHGQVMVFDFESKKVIGSYPIAVQLIDLLDGPATQQARVEMIRALYYGSAGNGLFSQAAKRLASVTAKASTGNYLQVVSVELEDKARQTLGEYKADPTVFISRVADAFGERLYENNHVAYVPYSKGAAIGSKMAARFADGQVFQLELPTPDYRIYLRVRGFKKAVLDTNSIEAAWGYAAYTNVAIKSFDDSTVYLDAPFKFAVTKKVLAGTRDQDDWSALQESMLALIDQTTLQIAKPDRTWLEEWSSGKPAQLQLEKLSAVLQRVR